MTPIWEGLDLIRDGYDMVIGRRVKSDTLEETAMDHYRTGHQIGNRFLSYIFSKLFNMTIKDTLSGWRLLSPGFVASFNRTAGGFQLEAEFNAHAFLLRSKIKELDVEYFPRKQGSESKLSTYSDGIRILRANFKLFRAERPKQAFAILIMPLLLAGGLLMKIALEDYWKTGMVSRFPSLIAAFSLFTISSLLWVTGMILERLRINRETIIRFVYKQYSQASRFHNREGFNTDSDVIL
jgi:hypothetical protein